MKTVNTEEMIVMIEMFMSLRYGNTYAIDSKSKFMFTGDVYQVQEGVLKWLSSPPRLENMKLMKNYRQDENTKEEYNNMIRRPCNDSTW